MDRAEKIGLTLALIMLLGFFVLVVYAAKGLKIDIPTCITDVEPFQQGKLIKHADKRYELHILAKMWLFDFNEGATQIKLPVGSVVDVYVTSKDVVHGVHINDTNFNVMAIPGTVGYLRVKFEKPGVYHVVCHEFCGVGHHAMEGKIVVE
ncbi:MAG: cytochrome C oxidase subunit II [Aquificae bacterium]|nr:cytochrome C oxidase subunit II [Aquificota bacterium]